MTTTWPVATSQDKMHPIFRIKHEWPNLAKELVLSTLPNIGTAFSLEDIIAEYGLSQNDFLMLSGVPAFQKLYAEEMQRTEELGFDRAVHQAQSSAMASDMREYIYRAVREDKMEMKDVIKAYDLFMRDAGLVTQGGAGAQVQVTVPVQINFPNLSNPKLDHLKKLPA